MSQLSTEVKNMAIIFHDKSKIFITAKEASAIFQASATNKDKILLNGCLYGFSTIAKILTLEEFYNEYPKEKPPVYDDQPKYVSQIQKPTKNAKELLIKGFRRFCEEHPEAEKANATLKKYDATGIFNLDICGQEFKL